MPVAKLTWKFLQFEMVRWSCFDLLNELFAPVDKVKVTVALDTDEQLVYVVDDPLGDTLVSQVAFIQVDDL